MAFNNAARTGNNYLFTGRKPLDARFLVDTYEQLLDTNTWTEGTSIIAYNGMITAVWLDPDTAKNGIYFLHDASVKNSFKAPGVSDSNNWHKLCDMSGISDITTTLDSLRASVVAMQNGLENLQGSATEVVEYRAQLPETGVAGKIYVVTDEAITYVWHNNEYITVGDGNNDEAVDIQIIMGGGPTA